MFFSKIKEIQESNNIAFVDFGLPIYPKIYEHEPIGGSELSILLHAEYLSLFHQKNVTIYNSNQQTYYDRETNIQFKHYSQINYDFDKYDTIIFNRTILPFSSLNNSFLQYLETLHNIKIKTGKKIYLYMHDAYDQPNTHLLINKDYINLFDKIICVSNWQMETFHLYFNVDKSKMTVIPNLCFKNDWIIGHDKRIFDFVFASIPHKGLYVLPDILNAIIKKTKNPDISILIISDYALYKQNNPSEYYNAIVRLKSISKNVFLLPLQSPINLMSYLKRSKFYIHPSTYHETFSIITVQSQINGCIPICVNNGALSELVKNNITGFITTGKTIYDSDTFNEFVDICIECLHLYDNRELILAIQKNMFDFAKQFGF